MGEHKDADLSFLKFVLDFLSAYDEDEKTECREEKKEEKESPKDKTEFVPSEATVSVESNEPVDWEKILNPKKEPEDALVEAIRRNTDAIRALTGAIDRVGLRLHAYAKKPYEKDSVVNKMFFGETK